MAAPRALRLAGGERGAALRTERNRAPPAQLTFLGNGVVPQQAARALEILAPPRSVCRHRTPR